MGVGAGIFKVKNIALHDQENIRVFFSQVEPHLLALREKWAFSYVATKEDDKFNLVQARLFLSPGNRDVPSSSVNLENIRAEYLLLSDIATDPIEFLRNLLESGKLATPIGEVFFRPEQEGNYSSYHLPFHPESAQEGRRLMTLMLSGRKKHGLVRFPHVDWELKAALKPFDSFAELMQEFQLGNVSGDSSTVEVLAHNIAEVDLSSPVSGLEARPSVFLTQGLSTNLVTLGYRAFVQGKVVQRDAIHGAAMQWTTKGSMQYGSASVEIPAGAVLHCVVSYSNVAQHQGYLADPSTFQNPQRCVFEAFDPGLAVLKDFIDKSGSRGTNARLVESSIAWLFSMLGFRVSHLGNIEQTHDAVDLILATPLNKFALVECTTGLINAGKVDLLVSRTEVVRSRLRASGTAIPKVIAVMVTTRPREEVKVGAELAEKLGVLILSREDLNAAVDRTIVLPDPEAIYFEGEQKIRRNENQNNVVDGGTF